jgi:hypothetical protein
MRVIPRAIKCERFGGLFEISNVSLMQWASAAHAPALAFSNQARDLSGWRLGMS